MDNKLLRIAYLVGKLILYVLYAILVLTVLVLGYVLISGNVEILSFVSFTESGLTISTNRIDDVGPPGPATGFLLFYGLKAMLAIVCYVFIIRESLKVVGSIQSLETFGRRNIKSFQRIGQLFAILFLLSLLQLGNASGKLELTIQLKPGYLLGTLVGYLLAEIFREGNNLMEENKLTI